MSPLDDAYLCIWKVECVLSLTETLPLSAAPAVFLCHVRRWQQSWRFSTGCVSSWIFVLQWKVYIVKLDSKFWHSFDYRHAGTWRGLVWCWCCRVFLLWPPWSNSKRANLLRAGWRVTRKWSIYWLRFTGIPSFVLNICLRKAKRTLNPWSLHDGLLLLMTSTMLIAWMLW